jgi:isoquinoline 1-oxidoreductase beta subunit
VSSPTLPADAADAPDEGTSRRRFLTYLVGAPTLAVAVNYLAPSAASAAPIPGSPESADVMDLGDILILAAKTTEANLIRMTLGDDGVVTVELPRAEVGQGLTTSVGMIAADELDLPMSKVKVVLAPAREELVFGQITGGSNTIRSVYEPTRMAAAAMRASLVAAAAKEMGSPTRGLTTRDGKVVAPGGEALTYASLATKAADPALFNGRAQPRSKAAAGGVVGKAQNRVDARAMVTGQLKYTNDLEPVPGILRAMVRRPPTMRGRVDQVLNAAEVAKMPGVRGVKVIQLSVGGAGDQAAGIVPSTGVAVVADTFGQALDAKEALEVTWLPGTVDPNENDETLKAKLKAIQLPLVAQAVPGVSEAVEGEFYWHFASHAPLETNTAIADVRADKATIWSGCKLPIVAQQTIANEVGLPSGSAVKVIVVQAGGSFGRRLFFDGALEAARISKAFGKPVKLMFTRIDDMRHGRARAASVNQVRMTYSKALGSVLSMEQRVASVETDLRHGLGEILTAAYGAQLNAPVAAIPFAAGGQASFAQSIFLTTVKSPYAFGSTNQLLNELSTPFNTGTWRSVYSAPARGAEEIMVDELAQALGKDPAAFRLEFLSNDRQKNVLKKVIEMSGWGKATPGAGRGRGIAFHEEYRSMTAIVTDVDVRNPNRPRVTKAWIAADCGLPVNPKGIEAQLLGGLTDAIATVFRAGLHLKDGGFLEGSYSQFHYARQADVPIDVETYVFPETTGDPGGCGELGVPAAVGAIANGWARATGKKPRTFPLVFPVDFTPFTTGTGSTRVRVIPPKKK